MQAFSGAEAYDEHAVVQREVAGRLADRIAMLNLPQAAEVCEIGCGTGFLGEALGGRLPHASWLATDISPEMLARARRRLAHDPRFAFALVDAEAPDLLEGRRFDLICSSLAAQWFSDLPAVLDRLASRLKPSGHLLLTTLVEGTFREWIRAHQEVELAAGSWAYPTRAALAAMRPRALVGEVEQETRVQAFPDSASFLRSLRAIGAHTPAAAHSPLSAGAFRRVLRRFEAAGSQVSYVVATFVYRRLAA